MKWEALPLADRARLMAAAVKNGYTDIRSIKEAYANYLNLKLSAGNRYAEGGDTDEPEVINLLDTLPIWKALNNIDYVAIPDPEFTKEKTGAGSIEYFPAEEPEGMTYNNGYHRDHPMPGKDVILYNPNDNDELDIRLDALHIMPKDSVYDTLNLLYREAAKDGDVAWAANQRYKEDVAKYGDESLRAAGMTPLQYFENEADGLLRNMFIEGDPKYIESKKYNPYKQKLRDWNSHLMPYIDNIQQYLETGEKPAWLLPEVTVTNQNAYGGNLFLNGGNKSRQSKKDYYRQLLIIRGLRGAQLEAVLANMEVESGFNPNAHNKSSGAHGLMQWLGSRKPKSWSEKDLLDYIAATYNKFGGNEWLDKKAWKRFNETTDPAEAARLFRRYWERPEKSSWYATDKYFGKSYLPEDTNNLISQIQDITWDDIQKRRKRFELTPEEERLYNSKPTLFYNADYADWNDHTNSKTFEQAYAPYALNSELDNSPSNGWALYNNLLNSQSLNDPLSWITMLASVSPRTTSRLKEAANTMYQLFTPQGDDYLYHGLNFAAYGGNVFRKGGRKNNAISVGGVTAGSRTNTEQCAKYSNSYLRDNGYIANGNAWNQSGGSVVFSGYDGLERPATFDKKAVEAYNSAASDNVWNNFDSNTLDKDSVYTVNMYYKGSPYLEEAFKNGTKGRTGTHTGYLKYENGDWYVVHNIHGKVHVDKFKSIQGGNKKYGVTGIYAPRSNNIFNRFITKLGFADGGHLYAEGDVLLKENADISPALQYVYGPNYEEVIKQRRRSWENLRQRNRRQGNVQQTKPKYDITQRADAARNTVSPVQHKMIEQVVATNPARQLKEEKDANARLLQHTLERQGQIGPEQPKLRHPDYDPVKAAEVQALREKEAEEDRNLAGLRRIEGETLDLVGEALKPVFPTSWVGSIFDPNTHTVFDVVPNLWSNTNRGIFNITQGMQNWYDKNPELGSIANLTTDIISPVAWTKALKALKSAENIKLANTISKGTRMASDADFSSNVLESYNNILENYLYGSMLSGNEDMLRYLPRNTSVAITEGISKDVQDYIMHNIIGRRILAGEKEGLWTGNVEQVAKEAMDKIKVGEFPEEVFRKAGEEHNAGMFNERNNFMAINRDDTQFGKRYIESHEGDHLIDTVIPQTEEQQSAIAAALDDDFLDLSNKPNAGALAGYTLMDKERTTTIHDAVRRLLTDLQLKWDIRLLNQIIDKVSDERIFKALEESNGYGRRYVEFLRENGKLTSEKANQLRKAMKIGCITLGLGTIGMNV